MSFKSGRVACLAFAGALSACSTTKSDIWMPTVHEGERSYRLGVPRLHCPAEKPDCLNQAQPNAPR